MYISQVGGVSPPGKPIRVVRACARFGCLVRSRADSGVPPLPLFPLGPIAFPFSLLPFAAFPFPLWIFFCLWSYLKSK